MVVVVVENFGQKPWYACRGLVLGTLSFQKFPPVCGPVLGTLSFQMFSLCVWALTGDFEISKGSSCVSALYWGL